MAGPENIMLGKEETERQMPQPYFCLTYDS